MLSSSFVAQFAYDQFIKYSFHVYINQMAILIGQEDFTSLVFLKVWLQKSKWLFTDLSPFFILQLSWVNQCGQSRSYRLRVLLATLSNLGAFIVFHWLLNFQGLILKLSIPETSGAPLVCFQVKNSLLVQEAKECTRFVFSMGFSLFFWAKEVIVPMLFALSSQFQFPIESFLSFQSNGRLVCLSKSILWKVFLAARRSFVVLICQLLQICNLLHFQVQCKSSLQVCSCFEGKYRCESRSSFYFLIGKWAARVSRTSGLQTQFRCAWVSLTSCRRKGLGFSLPGTLSNPYLNTANLVQGDDVAVFLVFECRILFNCSLSILYLSIYKTRSMFAPPFEKLLLLAIIQQNYQEFETFIGLYHFNSWLTYLEGSSIFRYFLKAIGEHWKF